MATENGVANAAAEAVLDEDAEETELENDSEESKEKKKERRARYFIPSRLEFRQDRMREQQERTVMIGPTTLADLACKDLMDRIKVSTQFFIRFFKEPNDQTNGSEPYKGHIEIRFDSIADADKCVSALVKSKKLRKGLSVKRITPEYVQDNEYKELRQIGNTQDAAEVTTNGTTNGTSADSSSPTPNSALRSGRATAGQRAARMVTITGLEQDVTSSLISEAFPGNTEVHIPKTYNGENPEAIKGYAYVEFESIEAAKKLENTKVKIGDGEQEYKVHLLLEIPNVDNVLRRIEKEKIGEIPRIGILEPAKRERLRLLLRYLSHYERLDDLPEEKLVLVKSKYNLVRKRLKVDYRREAATKRGGSKAGGKGRGAALRPNSGRGFPRGRGLRGYGGGFLAMRGRAPMYGMMPNPMMQQRPHSAPRGYNAGYQDPYDFDYGGYGDEYGYEPDRFHGYGDQGYGYQGYAGQADRQRISNGGFRGVGVNGRGGKRPGPQQGPGRGAAQIGYYNGGRRW